MFNFNQQKTSLAFKSYAFLKSTSQKNVESHFQSRVKVGKH